MIFPSLPLLHGHAVLEASGQRCILKARNPKLQIPQALCPPCEDIHCLLMSSGRSFMAVSFLGVRCIAACSRRADTQCLFYQRKRLIQAYRSVNESTFLRMGFSHVVRHVWTCFGTFLPALFTSFLSNVNFKRL